MSQLDSGVVAAWAASAWMHEPGPPGSPAGVESAEKVLGRRLPEALRELYLLHDGGSWFRGDLALMPVMGVDLSVAEASAAYRRWEWPVPDEVVIFGNDGGGDPFGLWLPAVGARPVVVHIGQIFEPGCMGVVGEDLNAFLRAWTALYLLQPDRAEATVALDALGLPEHLRAAEAEPDVYARIVEWASPTLTGSMSDPYRARLTPEDVHRIASDG